MITFQLSYKNLQKCLIRRKNSFESGDLDELESITNGMYDRIIGSNLGSEHQKNKSDTDIESN